MATNLLSNVLGIIFDKSTLQVIAVGYSFYSKRTYLLEEEASMEVARGGTKWNPEGREYPALQSVSRRGYGGKAAAARQDVY